MSEIIVNNSATGQEMPPFGMGYRDWFEYRKQLHAKKLKVLEAMKTIPKNGYNHEDGYYFARESDINDMIRELLIENKLDLDTVYVDRVWKQGTNIIEVRLKFIWTDVETGYFEEIPWFATAQDNKDKGIYKAYTGGSKYFLLRTFLMSQGDTDPEYTGAMNPKMIAAKQDQYATATQLPPNEVLEREAPKTPKKKEKPTQAKIEPIENELKEVVQQEITITVPPITAEQVGKIKTYLYEAVADSPNERTKNRMLEARIDAIAVRVKTWGAKIKGWKDPNEAITAMNEVEANQVIEFLEQWRENELKHKKMQENKKTEKAVSENAE